MAANSKNEYMFDDMLGVSLRRHSEAVPADFTERMLKQVREAESRRVLAQVILQERLALAASIVLGGLAVCGAVFIPGKIAVVLRRIGGGAAGYWGGLAGRVPQAVEAVGGEWQFYAVLAVVAGFAVYCLIDLLVGDRLRML